jgi:hypothetical protein
MCCLLRTLRVGAHRMLCFASEGGRTQIVMYRQQDKSLMRPSPGYRAARTQYYKAGSLQVTLLDLSRKPSFTIAAHSIILSKRMQKVVVAAAAVSIACRRNERPTQLQQTGWTN